MEIKANDIFSFIIIHDFPFFCKGAAGIFTQKSESKHTSSEVFCSCS